MPWYWMQNTKQNHICEQSCLEHLVWTEERNKTSMNRTLAGKGEEKRQ